MKAIEIRNLSKRYGKFQALNNISFDIEEGEFFGYLGPNGAGKTTTINIIIGLSNLSSGSVKVFGNDIVRDYIKSRQLIGISPQEFNFDPFLTVEQILSYQGGFFGFEGHKLNQRIDEVLEIFELGKKRKQPAMKLSGGMKRRLQIAKSIVHDPKILILDEPTAGLDLELRHSLWKYLTDLNKSGKTIILTTHYIEEAEKLCNHIGVINKGQIVALDKKENLIKKMSEQKMKIHLKNRLEELPKEMNSKCYELKDNVIIATCSNMHHEIPFVLGILNKHSIEVSQIDMVQDKLEDIYMRLTTNGE